MFLFGIPSLLTILAYLALVYVVYLDIDNNGRNLGWIILPIIFPIAGSLGYFLYYYWWIPRQGRKAVAASTQVKPQ